MIIPERVLSTMNKVRKFYCRSFQTGLKIALPFLPYRKPDIVVKSPPVHRCDRILIITDAGITKLGLIRRLEKVLTLNHISYFIYDKTVANPTTANVAEALELYHSNICNAIIGFGGGSSMDCANYRRYRKRDYPGGGNYRCRNTAQVCNQRFSPDS